MNCTFCEVKNCTQCKSSPFFGLDLVEDAFSEIELFRMSVEKKQEHTKELSFSGVQEKFGLSYDPEAKKIVLQSKDAQYMLKPEINAEGYRFDNFSVENEHISMRLAERMGIESAKSCVIPLGGHDLGYVTKRFDYDPNGGRYLKEDFGQLLKIRSASEAKYEKTVEDMGRKIDTDPMLMSAAVALKTELFRRVAANFILCNGDGHVKNFSIMKKERYTFSPSYDVLNTIVHIPGGADTAIPFLNDDTKTRGIIREDFNILGSRIGLRERVYNGILSTLISRMNDFVKPIHKLAINKEIRNIYIDSISDRIKRIS